MNIKLIKTIIGILLIILAVAYQLHESKQSKNLPPASTHSQKQTQSPSQQAVLDKIRQARNDTNARFWLTLDATVVKKLKDDRKGDQHQKFLIKVADDITLLVAHNIDIADYVPLSVGDKIRIKGRYEWNHRGGVIHWTHYDQRNHRERGWIYYNGKYYK